jgi:hypothetical protein
LVEALKVLRRETESGLARTIPMQERFAETLDRLRHLKPAEYAWLAGIVLVVAAILYSLVSNVGQLTPLLPLAIGCLLIYRRIRNQPRRMLELFVRKISKVPEVRFIVCEQGRITVGVDRAGGQLYGRINAQLNHCNGKMFYGQPLSVVIRDDLSAEEARHLLAGPGVQYVRDDAVQTR